MLKRLTSILLVCSMILATSVSVYADTTSLKDDLIDHMESVAVESMKLVWDIEDGVLTEDASEELLDEAVDIYELLPEDNEHRKNLEVIADEAEKQLKEHKKLNGETYRYFGSCTTTGYCAGPCCCGQWASGNTASGTRATQGRTVAHNYLPFGTRVLIDGVEYVVEDRGDDNMSGGMWFDIFFQNHGDASNYGMRTVDVYIIE